MSTNKSIDQKDPEVAIDHAIGKTELFIEKHGKKLLIALIAIIVIVGGYFAYNNLYSNPRAVRASAAMFEAQTQFERDSFAVALNGNGVFMGFDEIITEFGSTPQANLATHYAGICCLRTGDYQKAISYFEKFNNQEGGVGEVISAQNIGLIGDCYTEMGETAKGTEYYLKAVALSDNIVTAPAFLQKAAINNLATGNAAQAVEQFKTIKSQFPTSIMARDIDKYIALAEQKL